MSFKTKMGLTFSALALALASNASLAASPQQTMAMKCYVTYDLLIDAEAPKDDAEAKYQNQVLGSQALFMASVYTAYAQGSGGRSKAYLSRQFQRSSTLARDAILNAALMDSETLKTQVLKCEAWREQSIMSITQSQVMPGAGSSGSQVLTSLPEPDDLIPINGDTIELSLFIDKTMNRIRSQLEEGRTIVGNGLIGDGTNAIEDGYIKDKIVE